ncbi:MAG: hypothetical protein IJJ33_19390 [Victivallales bacterium]|nr:hypothetical protein [Victivallales bacterium]
MPKPSILLQKAAWGMLAALLLPGCQTDFLRKQADKPITPEEKAKYVTLVRHELDSIHSLVAKGEYAEAEMRLSKLSQLDFQKWETPYFQEEITELNSALRSARELHTSKGSAAISAQRIRQASEHRFVLPESYGNTVVIDSDLNPLEMPAGPMEEVYNSKVTIHLQNAGIAELVEALKNVVGLNVIADDALQAKKTLTIAVDEVPLREILGYISRNMGIAFHLGANVVWITASQKDEENGGNGPALETRIIRLPHGSVPSIPGGAGGLEGGKGTSASSGSSSEDKELQDALTTFMADSPAGASFRLYPDRNVLIIRDTRENLRLAEELIRELDRPPKQVSIEARFLTVSRDDLKDVGAQITQRMQAAYRDPSLRESLREINFLTELGALTAGNVDGVGALNLGGVIGNRSFDILISALDKKASTTSLSAPSITVLNNRVAHIRRGETKWYYEDYEVETIDRGDNRGDAYVLVPDGDPTELQLGLVFDVKVNIGNDGRTLMLVLKPQIKEWVGWEMFNSTGGDEDSDSGSGAKLPITYNHEISTSVKLQSGETVVLGGMLSEATTKTVKKIPLLGDIPWIGWLFRHTTTTNVPQNLLIFVTAHILNEKGEYVETQETANPAPVK